MWSAVGILVVVPRIFGNPFVRVEDLIPGLGTESLNGVAPVLAGLVLLLALGAVASAPLLVVASRRRGLLIGAAVVVLCFAFATILYNGLWFLPGGAALAAAAARASG